MKRILCLSGWAQPHDVLAPYVPDAKHLDYADAGSEQAVMSLLAENYAEIDMAVGWSLGGWLLMRAMAAGHIEAKHLVVIGAPVQFVNDPSFHLGMGRQTFELFCENFSANPTKTAEKFAHLIAENDNRYDTVVEALQSQMLERFDHWQWGLDVLSSQKSGDIDYSALPPVTIIHGEQDRIVPVEQAEFLADMLDEGQLFRISDCAHAPHYHAPLRIRQIIDQAPGYALAS